MLDTTPRASADAQRSASQHPLTSLRLIGPRMQPAGNEPVSGALAELATLDQWVISKLTDGQKPPYSPLTRRKCSHSNPSQWSSYQVALDALAGFDWLGFVFHESDPYTGVDLDGCRDKDTGAIEGWAQRWIDALDSYTEVSPSGTGVKVFVRGTLPEQLTHSLGAHKGIEVYSAKRFFTVTGQQLAGTPGDIRDAQPALDMLWAEYHKEAPQVAPRKEYRVSIGQTANGRQSAREVIEGLNRKNDLGDYLEYQGARLVRTRGDVRYYTGLAGELHSNGQTFIVSPAKDGAGHIGMSYSPNGKLSKVDFSRGFRWFDAAVALEYSGDVTAALKALNPIQPRQQAQAAQQATPEQTPTPELVEARRKDAQRKKEQRQAAADELRETILGRAAIDEDMPWQARLLLDTHLKLAGQRGWHRVSIARMAGVIGRGDRWVQRFNEYLIDSYVSRTLTSRHDTAIWTLLEKPIQRIDTPETDDLGVIELEPQTNDDHPNTYIIESIENADYRICEGGASSPDDWQWSNDEHGPDELSALEAQPAGQVDTAKAELLVYVYALACEAGQVASYDGYTFAQLETEADRLAAVLDAPPSQAQTVFNDAAEPECTSYTPVELIHLPYSGTTSRQYMTFDQRADLVRESMRMLPEVDAGDTPEQLPLEPAAADTSDLLVRCAPSDPKAAREYYKLKKAKAKSPAQARWMRRRVAELEELRPLSEALSTPAQAPRPPHQRPTQPEQAAFLAMAA
jgi:hypothetical protein